MHRRIVVLLLVLFGFVTAHAHKVAADWKQIGEASWYGKRHHGRLTASGTRFNRFELTCAHRFLPFGTLLRVTTKAGRSVIVTVTDRGPYAKRRIIDLSYAAAMILGISGVARVTLTPVILQKLEPLPEVPTGFEAFFMGPLEPIS